MVEYARVRFRVSPQDWVCGKEPVIVVMVARASWSCRSFRGRVGFHHPGYLTIFPCNHVPRPSTLFPISWARTVRALASSWGGVEFAFYWLGNVPFRTVCSRTAQLALRFTLG